jgi:hypothetical protein
VGPPTGGSGGGPCLPPRHLNAPRVPDGHPFTWRRTDKLALRQGPATGCALDIDGPETWAWLRRRSPGVLWDTLLRVETGFGGRPVYAPFPDAWRLRIPMTWLSRTFGDGRRWGVKSCQGGRREVPTGREGLLSVLAVCVDVLTLAEAVPAP